MQFVIDSKNIADYLLETEEVNFPILLFNIKLLNSLAEI